MLGSAEHGDQRLSPNRTGTSQCIRLSINPGTCGMHALWMIYDFMKQVSVQPRKDFVPVLALPGISAVVPGSRMMVWL